MASTKWYPAHLFEGKPVKPYSIIVLNQPLNKNAFDAVVEKAALLVCADAGANHLMQYEKEKDAKHRIPDAIIGDLDSISAEARHYYSDAGSQIVEDPDQYSTDFTKCLRWLRIEWDKRKGENEELDVVVMGGLGGRVDQGFSQVHHLYLALREPNLLHGHIYLLSEQSLSFVLGTGKNELHVNDRVFAQNVGIIPVLGLTHISTSGFEWDVEHWPTEFGGQVSTSNHIKSDLLSVTVDGPRPVFTVEMAGHLCAFGLS